MSYQYDHPEEQSVEFAENIANQSMYDNPVNMDSKGVDGVTF